MDPDTITAAVVLGIISWTLVLFPIARAFARRVDRGGSTHKVPSEVTQRLERMEQAIDSIALEIERISEGQRFTTRLLADRPGQQELAPPGGQSTNRS
ncbi:MAG: hypothetical protein H7Z74_05595 [Anaerolineae bacterium]|nr:hypothetical protein [Gemmatimonadaceae bacterium]